MVARAQTDPPGWWRRQGIGIGANLIALVLPLMALPVAAAPPLTWANPNDLSDISALRLSDLIRARCLPDAADFSVPVYPRGAIIDIAWGRQPPDCRLRAGWSQLGAVDLVTRSDVGTVAAWYAERLDDHSRFETPQGVLFLRGEPATFNFERDYFKYPNVYIRNADPVWRRAGFVAIIELNSPAP